MATIEILHAVAVWQLLFVIKKKLDFETSSPPVKFIGEKWQDFTTISKISITHSIQLHFINIVFITVTVLGSRK